MGVRFQTSRFHVEYGPHSLFERVKFKFLQPRTLKLNGKHYKQRKEERNIPSNIIDYLLDFNPAQWKLVTAEVRNDTGKFVNTTWEKMIFQHKYWVTIGFGDIVQTIIRKDSEGFGYDIIKEGTFYDFVSEVNDLLMKQDTSQ
ncbi:hypothetical protein RCG23_13810 [Neobacillus sp. PS3-34]|uniref:hypothetical protein n=1 Tax=Neobacillus sp. PS3-34 TaxID=3070678 RepID=UPI0027DF9992|nr:hypothetical protein [Neobacillus sp. PS3-34]WML46720.1 hypothetical protein RCG23_13810 [Neobacillus sp. PS3-34]